MKTTLTNFLLLLTISTFISEIEAQAYFPGVSYLDSTSHIEYIAGNLPIILSAAHGGYREPDSVALRDCSGCTTIRDAFTQELTREITENIYLKTGCYPYVIINLLHRNRLDANRDIDEAADGDLIAEQAWRAFHRFIDLAKDSVSSTAERGIFYDVHGHGHSIQRIELGYALSKDELQMTDETLNTDELLAKSSIRQLAIDNIQGLSHAELIRGIQSMGSLLIARSVLAVPSLEQAYPLDQEDYFSGGYNTRRHGSRDGGNVDAIQIECHQDVRFEEEARIAFADSLSNVLLDYMSRHYNAEIENSYCLTSSVVNTASHAKIKLYPNPSKDFIFISSTETIDKIYITNVIGERLPVIANEEGIDITHLPFGVYSLTFLIENKLLSKKIVKY